MRFPLWHIVILCLIIISISGCKKEVKTVPEPNQKVKAPNGMVWVETKTFLQGAKASDKYAMHREKPAHESIFLFFPPFFVSFHSACIKSRRRYKKRVRQ